MLRKRSKKPVGVRDFLFESAEFKRNIEQQVFEVFSKWGYQEVLTPSFEYLETFLMGNSFELGDKIFKFFDRKGRVLALRPDMTTPIARLVANHYSSIQYPLRLCYFANIFRFEDLREGRQSEMFQAGAELVGWDEIDADAEIIALSIESLKKVGIKEFKINIGHTGFWEGILKSEKNNTEQKELLKESLLNKDFVSLKKIIKKLNINKEKKNMLLNIIKLHGGIEVLELAEKVSDNEISIQAIKQLKDLSEVLDCYNVNNYITFDLGLMRDLDYYTGIIFEAYTPELGYPICGGGRYDNLIEKFNGKKPSTGFALNIDGILKIYERSSLETQQNKDYLIVYTKNTKATAIRKALELRSKGKTVDIMPEKYVRGKSHMMMELYIKTIKV